MPTGKVKWFDADKGFGFPQGGRADVYVHADALPEGTTTIKPGARGFGIAQGGGATRRCRSGLDRTQSVSRNRQPQHARRKARRQMATIVEDLIRLLDDLGEGLPPRPAPRRPDRPTDAKLLRALADELEL